MDRVGESRCCLAKKYVCEAHTFETIIKRRLVRHKGKIFFPTYKLTVPPGEGTKSSLSPSKKASKGTGRDRANRFIFEVANSLEVNPNLHMQHDELDKLLKQLEEEYKLIIGPEHKIRNLEEQNLVREAKLELANANVVHATKVVQQMAEEACPDKHIPVNASLCHVF